MLKKDVIALLKSYQAMDHERLELNQKAAKLEQAQKGIIDQLVAATVNSGVYGPYLLEAQFKKVPRCTDWAGFHAYILSSGNLDMLHKRLTETAVMARVSEGEYVPGIVVDEKTSYKIKAA